MPATVGEENVEVPVRVGVRGDPGETPDSRCGAWDRWRPAARDWDADTAAIVECTKSK